MVSPVVSAVAPAVVQSATDDQGLINQAFKLTILIGLALAVGVGIFLIYSLTGILSGISGFFQPIVDVVKVVGTVPQIATSFFASTLIGRGYLNFRRIVG